MNYALRFWRWELYLRTLEARLPLGPSLAIFLVGFLLSITPGKAGELGKAWLARELGGGPARRVVPAVLGERFTDVLGVVLLVSLGALAFSGGLGIFLAGLVLVLLSASLLSWSRGAAWILERLGRLPVVGQKIALLGEVYDLFRRLLRIPMLAPALLLSVLAWGAEGVGFVLVARAYAPEAGWLSGVFNYSLSTLVGALSLLPGGLVASEGTLTALLGAQGFETAAAASATLIIRGATLWFAVLLGLAALPWVLWRLHRSLPAGY